MFPRSGLRILYITRRTHLRPQCPTTGPHRIPPASMSARYYATPPPQIKPSMLSVERYHALSDTTMGNLWEKLEELLDVEGNPSYEVEYSSGVLTLKLGQKGTYVINKQPPNKQIWLSSPISGPKRYDYSESKDAWFYSRDGGLMGDLLNKELSEAFGRGIDLALQDVSKRVE